MHEVKEAAIIAEELKLRIVEIAGKKGSIYLSIYASIKKWLQNMHDQLLKNTASEIWINHALEQPLFRVREDYSVSSKEQS